MSWSRTSNADRARLRCSERPRRARVCSRSVHGDVLTAFSIEQRHVFRLGAGFGVGQGVESLCVDLGDEVAEAGHERPHVAAQVAQIDRVRLRPPLRETAPPRGADRADRRSSTSDALSHEFLDVCRIRTDVRRVETGLKRLGAAEDLQLAFLGLGRRMETDFAPPEQDETCRALVDFGDECRPIRQRQIEIFDRAASDRGRRTVFLY